MRAKSTKPQVRRSKDIPITGISLFIADRKAEEGEEHQELSKLQLFSFLNDQWNALNDSTKETYERRADYARRAQSRRVSKTKGKQRRLKASAYSCFARDRHEALKLSSPEFMLRDRAQLIATEWETMDHNAKLPFINAAKRETRRMQRRDSEDESSDDSDSDDSSS
jgi:hypothetical protein